MENKKFTEGINTDEKKYVNMITFDELSAENNEIIESIESLRMTNSAIKTGCSELLSSTNKLLESMRELALLLN